MDQNDRQDGNTKTDKEILIPEQPNVATPMPEVRPASPAAPAGAMTHARPEVETEAGQSDIEPASINTVETTTVGPEIEPTTVAYKPDDGSNKPSEQASSGALVQATSSNSQPSVAPSAVSAVSTKDKKKLIIVVAAIVILFAALGALAWWMLGISETSGE